MDSSGRPQRARRPITLAYENFLRSMSRLEAATFEHGLPKGTASGLEVQASAGETDFKRSRATGVRRISPNDPKVIVWEHHEESKTQITFDSVFKEPCFRGNPDFRSSPSGLRCGFGYTLQIKRLLNRII